MFERIAIADHGGSAWRAVQTIQAMREHSSDLHVTLIHLEDEPSRAVAREVDTTVMLPNTREPGVPTEAADHAGAMARWLERSASEVDAVWVGWGHPDSHLAIATACEATGATFVGPTAATLRSLDDRTVLGRIASVDGMELSGVSDPVPRQARHLEVQVLADGSGKVWVVAIVDRSLAPDGRPLLASSPALNLDPGQRAALEHSARTFAAKFGLRGAAAIDLLLMPATAPTKLMGVRPHLTPTHVLAELTTGLDVVELQFALAAGLTLDAAPPEPRGHAVATTLLLDELPDPSPSRTTVDRLDIASPPGARIDLAVREGDQVPAQIGTELVTIGATGRDRSVALARLTHVVSRTTVMLGSGATDRFPLLQVLRHPDVSRGALDTGWLDRTGPRPRPGGLRRSHRPSPRGGRHRGRCRRGTGRPGPVPVLRRPRAPAAGDTSPAARRPADPRPAIPSARQPRRTEPLPPRDRRWTRHGVLHARHDR
jgi:biotin carboxylase